MWHFDTGISVCGKSEKSQEKTKSTSNCWSANWSPNFVVFIFQFIMLKKQHKILLHDIAQLEGTFNVTHSSFYLLIKFAKTKKLFHQLSTKIFLWLLIHTTFMLNKKSYPLRRNFSRHVNMFIFSSFCIKLKNKNVTIFTALLAPSLKAELVIHKRKKPAQA